MSDQDCVSKSRSDYSADSPANEHELLLTIARIRSFEERLLQLFGENKLHGTTHTCIGQEVCAAALYAHIDPTRDAVFSNHRCHGHFLAYGGPIDGLLSEIMGREGGVCSGRGGSQHLCYGRFHSSGVQGSGVPIAAGYAHRLREENSGGIVVAHIGDGTLGQGVVYETLNIASLLSLPLLIVLEHNGYAQSTDTSMTIAGDFLKRFEGFGIESSRVTANDPVELSRELGGVVERVRRGRPFVQVLDTFRLMAHSKGDDDRPSALIRDAWANDYFDQELRSMNPAVVAARDAAAHEISQVSADVESRPLAQLGDIDVYAKPKSHFFNSSGELRYELPKSGQANRINQELNQALHRIMADDNDVRLIGEDLADPYGGAFKVTLGLSAKYPDRVFSSPISEAAIVGFGTGIALANGRPVIEIMFGDFATLAADQLINQAAKIFFMYAEQVAVPLTIRLVSGGYRGYGATHSQSLEALFCGIPGLKVVALSKHHDAYSLLKTVILHDDNPVIFVENKTLYALKAQALDPVGFEFQSQQSNSEDSYPSLFFTTGSESADVTVVTYGGLTSHTEEAMEEMIIEHEVDFDYFVLTQLYPLDINDIVSSVRRTKRLLVIEEGPVPYGIGSEIIAQISERLTTPFESKRVGANSTPIPSSRQQELDVLPSREVIANSILSLYGGYSFER